MRVTVELALLSCLTIAVFASGCGDDESGDGDGSGASSGSGGGSSQSGGASGIGASGTGASAGTGAGSASGGGGVGAGSSTGGGRACATELLLVAESDTTFECGFPIPTPEPPSFNLLFVKPNGVTEVVCRVFDGGACTEKGGWWTNGGEILLCDLSCFGVDEPGGKFYVEVGCPTENCTGP